MAEYTAKKWGELNEDLLNAYVETVKETQLYDVWNVHPITSLKSYFFFMPLLVDDKIP